MANILTFQTWEDQEVRNLIQKQHDDLDVLKWAYHEYGDRIVYASSFGAEGIVLIDLIHKVKKDARIIFLDTGFHFPETLELIDKVKQRYPTLNIEMVKPNMTVEEQANKDGDELWKENPNLCCHARKVIPLKDALANADAWISGLRREQSPTRKNTQYINKDEKFRKIKICPLIYWTWNEVVSYLKLNQLPYNPLHDKGYPSIGCAPCTRPVVGSDDQRAGRWAGNPKTECGLHIAGTIEEK